jgi:hypothetical protein
VIIRDCLRAVLIAWLINAALDIFYKSDIIIKKGACETG